MTVFPWFVGGVCVSSCHLELITILFFQYCQHEWVHASQILVLTDRYVQVHVNRWPELHVWRLWRKWWFIGWKVGCLCHGLFLASAGFSCLKIKDLKLQYKSMLLWIMIAKVFFLKWRNFSAVHPFKYINALLCSWPYNLISIWLKSTLKCKDNTMLN